MACRERAGKRRLVVDTGEKLVWEIDHELILALNLIKGNVLNTFES